MNALSTSRLIAILHVKKVLEGLLQLAYLPTSLQLVDILTKILPSAQHNEILSQLGIGNHCNSSPPHLEGGVEDGHYRS